METKLERISQLSRENPDMVFTSIGHLISTSLLKDVIIRWMEIKQLELMG